jgi:type IV secretory pathway VirB2 component (pilin)
MSDLISLVEKLQTTAQRIGSELLLPFGGAIAVVFLIWGGIQYMNNPEAGKKTVIATVIGLVVIALASLLIFLVNDIL